MRKLIYAINLTLDGCCDHTKSTGYEDVHEYFTDLMRGADLLVYGRITYELMVPFWPDVAKNRSMSGVTNEFANLFDSIEKLVFSKTLKGVDDKNSRLARANPHDEILKLKQEPGRNILLGGVALPSQLIALGLVDEFIFVVQPVLVGEGRRLLDDISLPEKLELKLEESKVLESGCIVLRYLKGNA